MPAARVEPESAFSGAPVRSDDARAGIDSSAPLHPGGELGIVVAKLRILADRFMQCRPGIPARTGYDSIRAALSAMDAIVDASRGADNPDSIDPAALLVADLFAFLEHSGEDLFKAIRAEPGPHRAPTSAHHEHRAGGFWRVAALIQDAWEHAMEPSARERDTRVLELLARLDWPDCYDFGAGGGYFAIAAARHGASVLCNEINSVKRQFLRFRRGAAAHRKIADQIELGGASRCRRWPAAMAIDVLDHVSNPVATIEALAARIQPDGHLLLQAGFPDDGWHRSGDELIGEVHASLIRNFTIASLNFALVESGFILLQRRRRPLAAPPELLPSVRVHLDPAARLRPEASGEAIVIAAPRFFAGALRLTPDGARVAEACRGAPTLAELRREFTPDNTHFEVIDAAVSALVEARLATLEFSR